jgi:hypothetical protein
MGRISQIAFIVGAVALALTVVGAFISSTQFFQSYLFAYMFWLGPALGSFFFLLIQNLTGGRWGLLIRRFLEGSAMTLPLLAILFIPVIVGIGSLYEWADPVKVAEDKIIQFKTPYLNVSGFIIRTVIYFALWCGVTYLLRRWSIEQDKKNDPAIASRMQAIAGPALVFHVLAITFATTDWVMSLEPHWFSTIYGVLYIVGYGLTTLAMCAILLYLFGNVAPLSSILNADVLHDIGKLMFAFTVLWAYTNFSQYVITWTGNIPEFTPWYLHRTLGGWEYIAIALMIGQFILPFFILMMRRTKRDINALAFMAAFILIMRAVDIFWFVTPAFHPEQFHINWMDITAFVGLGGLFVGMLMRNLAAVPLLPAHDERLEKAIRAAHSHGH